MAEAKYLSRRQVYAEILAQENLLRAEFQRIAELDRPVRAQSDRINEMRAVGADLIWRSWVSRSRTSLNLQLVRVLARKEQEKVAVQRAFGKLTALETLIRNEKRERKKTLVKAQMEVAIACTLWRPRAGQ